jgi:hypothetical protein
VTDRSLPLQALIDHLRWLGREGDAPDRTPRRGGMGEYARVKDAALRDAYHRAAEELARVVQQDGRDGRNGRGDSDWPDAALLGLAAALRERCLAGEVPADVRPPRFPIRPDRPPPTLDPERARREAQIGFQLGLARAAALIHEAGGGHF